MRKGSAGGYHWEKISGRWQFIDGRWYYLNPVSDGTRGIMCARKNQDGSAGIMYSKRRTPDGWYVKEDGSWDEEAGR